jgi:lysophospholipase L1-like esterase
MRRPIVIGLAMLLIAGAAVPATVAADHDSARTWYVSLGDSLAAGVQPIGDPAAEFRTQEGYAEQLLGIARGVGRKINLAKLGCPGESTTTMIHGGLCEYEHGSQLDEATAFLRSHRDRVAFVTLDIGPNDFPCNGLECAPQGIQAVSTNLPLILTALRQAAGPSVPIVGMSMYNPLLGAWLLGPEGQAYAQGPATQAMSMLNALLAGIYGQAGVPVADVAGAFASLDFTTLVEVPGLGMLPLGVARVCAWTWACTPPPLGPVNHANRDGYAVIARAFADVLGI